MEKNLKVKIKTKTEEKSIKLEPTSPTSGYFLSEIATLYVLTVFELEIPIDTLSFYNFFNGVFLDSHPRLSCIPIEGKNGRKYWKKVKVNVKDHIIKTPILAEDYISELATTQYQLNKPLWEVHTFNYPTNNATSTLIIKFHHAIADGVSLMGVLLTCCRRVDDPTLPVVIPSRTSLEGEHNVTYNVMKTLAIVPRFLSSIVTSTYDYGQTLRAVLFVLQLGKRTKKTVNDVVTGIISFATRLYIQEVDQGRVHNWGRMTASIVFNIRSIKGYATSEEMRKGNTWGNKISVIELSLPKYKEEHLKNPLNFVMNVHKIMKRKVESVGAIYLAAWTLDAMRIFGGFKSLTVSVMSYMDNQRIGLVVENGFIDHQRLIASVEKAYHLILQAATASTQSTVHSKI